MDGLRVLLTKRADGAVLLRCIRADGSETWQKVAARHAAHFPVHDLTHYAVERELDIHDAFFGLIAAGWSLEETEGKGARGALPEGAIFVENLVGLFDMERAGGTPWNASEFNDALAAKARQEGRPAPRTLEEAELSRIRQRRADLFRSWETLAPGETFEVPS